MEFFPRQRRRATLTSWSPKHNQENEKRVLINFAIPLSGNISGIPDFATEAFKAIETQDTPIADISLDTEIEGVTLEFFDHNEAKRRCYMLTAATLRKFTLTRKDKETLLTFNTTVPRPQEVYEWLHKYEACDLFISFDATQAKLVFAEGEEDPNQSKLFTGEQPAEEEQDDHEEEEVNRVRKNFGVGKGKAAKARK
jgi:hypothetical protein